MSQIVWGDDTVQTMSESVYFCSSSRRITVLPGVGSDAGWFLLVTCTERVSTAVSSCFQARLTEIAQLWNSLKPPFVAFWYSEDLYRRELTGRVMLRVPDGGLAVCGIVGDPFPVAWSWPLTSILLPSQWMSGAIRPLLICLLCRAPQMFLKMVGV